MQKRKSPISKNLVKNSISGMFAAIEIHNKPAIKYRYETVVLLVLNSWELLIKGYIYKYHKKIKLFQRDGTTKPFESCVNIVTQKLGNDFDPIRENLTVLYDYRNQVAHFYISELDPIIFSLISKNLIFYSNFLRNQFKIDMSKESDLVLLPIGFKRPISPIDYISNASGNDKTSPEVKCFLQKLVESTKRLNDKEIDDTIFIDFRINLVNVNRIKNADLIAGIDNSRSNELNFSVNKEPKKVIISNSGEKVRLSRNRDETQGTLLYEELAEGIFDEINNILDANRLLARGTNQFLLGESIYYRIYSERQHVTFNIETYELLARAGIMNFYGPFLYWLIKLPPQSIAKILVDLYNKTKSPYINNLIKIVLILGNGAITLFSDLFTERYMGVTQKPDFYYTFLKQKKSKQIDPICRALNSHNDKVVYGNNTIRILLHDSNYTRNLLSQECLKVFNGIISQRSVVRNLDFIGYGQHLVGNLQIIAEINKNLH